MSGVCARAYLTAWAVSVRGLAVMGDSSVPEEQRAFVLLQVAGQTQRIATGHHTQHMVHTGQPFACARRRTDAEKLTGV
jgi:hypothetical protein